MFQLYFFKLRNWANLLELPNSLMNNDKNILNLSNSQFVQLVKLAVAVCDLHEIAWDIAVSGNYPLKLIRVCADVCIPVHTRRQHRNRKLTNGFQYSSTSLHQSETSMRARVRFYICIKYLWSGGSKKTQDWGPDRKQQKLVGFKSWFKPKPTYTHAHTHAHTWQTSLSIQRKVCFAQTEMLCSPSSHITHSFSHTPSPLLLLPTVLHTLRSACHCVPVFN